MPSESEVFKIRTDITAGQKHVFMRYALKNYDLTGAAYKVLYVLCDLHNNKYGYSYPTYDDLQSETKGLRRDTISEALKQLAALGLIEIKRSKNNRYWMAWHLIDEPQEPAAPRAGIQRHDVPVDESGKQDFNNPEKPDSNNPEKPNHILLTDPSYLPILHDTAAAPAPEYAGRGLSSKPADQPQAGNDNWPADAADQFYFRYPYREYYDAQVELDHYPDTNEDEEMMERELDLLRRRSTPFDAIMDGATRYRDHVHQQGRAEPVLSPQEWLRGKRWLNDHSSSSEAA